MTDTTTYVDARVKQTPSLWATQYRYFKDREGVEILMLCRAANDVTELWDYAKQHPGDVWANIDCSNSNGVTYDVFSGRRVLTSRIVDSVESAVEELKFWMQDEWKRLFDAPVKPNGSADLGPYMDELNTWIEQQATIMKQAAELNEMTDVFHDMVPEDAPQDLSPLVWVEYGRHHGDPMAAEYKWAIFPDEESIDDQEFEIVAVDQHPTGIKGLVLRDFQSGYDFVQNIPGAKVLFGPAGLEGELLVWVPEKYLWGMGQTTVLFVTAKWLAEREADNLAHVAHAKTFGDERELLT